MDVNVIELNGNFYGLPTDSVCEVLNPMPVTPLPFSPDYVDGLTNVSGKVIVQLDLSVQLERAAPIPLDSGQLVVVESGREKIALHVSRAVLMVKIDDDEIRSVEKRESPLDGLGQNRLAGEFQWQDQAVLLLAVDQLGLRNLELAEFPEDAEGLVAAQVCETGEDLQEAADEALQSYMVVESNDESYALPMKQVRFVEDLDTLTTLPQAPPEVMGMIYIHNSPFLVLGLDRLMGRQGEPESGQKLIIVQHQDFRCALRVNRLVGIRQLALRDNHEILAKEGELEGYLVGDSDRLIGVLNFEGLFSPQRISSFRRYLVSSDHQETQGKRISTRALLTFRVGREQCALPLELVKQVMQYQRAEQVPDGGSDHLHGMVEIQGAILPVVDLRRQLEMKTETTPLTAYIVAGEEGNRWALIVDQVNRVIEIPETDLETTRTQERQHLEAIGRINNGLVNVMNLASLTAVEPATETELSVTSELME